MPVRVLVVDDSAVVRRALSEGLSRYDDIEVVGAAADPYAARDLIVETQPDVLTLDVEMPLMDGLSFLERLMRHHPMPVVIVSSLTPKHSDAAVRALGLGAVAVVPKPGSRSSVPDVERQLVQAVRAAARATVRQSACASAPPALTTTIGVGRRSDMLIAIGASTGGVGAIEEVLRAFPADAPPVLIAQHMPAAFTTSFAQRLDHLCHVVVREARDGEFLALGLALVAPGNVHLVVQRRGGRWVARLREGPLVHHQRPSVDVLFRSVAQAASCNAVGVLLTGMGEDGARGLLELREQGAHTIAQDELSSVVYGMPRAAAEIGAAREICALGSVAQAVLDACHGATPRGVGQAG
ncbi:MAG: chemotaxis response regulator protein-glutamate methylesterase [Gemmatimonadaceae bacterium]